MQVRITLKLSVVILTLIACTACHRLSDVKGSVDKAKEYQQADNHVAAIIELKNVLQADPANAESRFLLGREYLDFGDARSAESELRRARDQGWNPPQTTALLARSLIMQGKIQEALDESDDKKLGGAQRSADILTVRSFAHLVAGRRDESKRLMDEAVALKPEDPNVLLGQARLAALDKKPDDAMRLIDRAISISPKDPEGWLLKLDLSRDQGDLDGAIAAGQKIVETRSEHVPARLSLASLYISKGSFDDARKQISLVKSLAPSSPLGNYLQALLEFRSKNYPAARNSVSQVIKVAPNHMPSVLLAGAVEFALDSQAQAQLYLKRVIENAPDNLYARRLMIASLAKSGQLPQAMDMMKIGLKQAPGDPALLTLAGEVSMQRNDFTAAAQFFDKAAKLVPKDATPRTGLGMSRLAMGERDHGLADLESAAALDTATYQADVALILARVKQGEFDQALKAAANLEKKQPQNPLTYNLKGGIYSEKKDSSQARANFEKALQLQPTYLASAINLAKLDLADKKPEAARRRFEQMLEKDKNNVSLLIVLAESGQALGASRAERLAWLDRANAARSGDIQLQLKLAQLYAQLNEPKKALEVATATQTLAPDDAQVLDVLGTLQMAANQKSQALVTFGKLVATQPNSPVALYELAKAQAANGDVTSAKATLRKALAIKPDFLSAEVTLAQLEIDLERFQDALAIARDVQKQAPKMPLGYMLEGDVLMKQKQFLQAARMYDTAFKLQNSAPLAIKAHSAYVLAKLPNEADARLSEWLKSSPDDAVGRRYLAEYNVQTGRFKEAVAQYEWLSTKQPNDASMLNNLAWVYQRVGDRRALETAERAYSMAPNNPSVADTLGWILIEQGNAQRAREVLQKAVDKAPNALDTRYHLAQALAKTGERAKAARELERILESKTKFAFAAEAQDLLKQLQN